MKWVNLQHNFGMPAKSFYISFQDLVSETDPSSIPTGQPSPVVLAELADRLLKKYRPELADSAVLAGMDVSLLKRCLELVYVHKSFTPLSPAEAAPSEPLIPRCEANDAIIL